MDTNTDWQPGWYHLATDPEGVQRYYDGSAWTDHTDGASFDSAVAAPADRDRDGSDTRHWSTVPAKEALIILAAAVMVVLLVAGGLGIWQVRGRTTNLTAADAAHALPSAAQVSSATGLTFGSPEKRSMSGADSASYDDDSCSSDGHGSGPATGALGATGGTYRSGSSEAAVIAVVAVFDSADHAQQFVDGFRATADRDRDCVVSAWTDGAFQPDATNVIASDHSLLASTSSQGVGVTYARSGNTVVLVAEANRSGAVGQDQLDQLLDVSLDAAGHPDPSRV